MFLKGEETFCVVWVLHVEGVLEITAKDAKKMAVKLRLDELPKENERKAANLQKR